MMIVYVKNLKLSLNNQNNTIQLPLHTNFLFKDLEWFPNL